ncbi:ferredoxin [Streptomyces sp. NPDC049577]|uniref:ferredoxin n=1 Tax=Streptomyces sp. NPDC049577 TaxID=3155153 RepID=UPI00341E27A7
MTAGDPERWRVSVDTTLCVGSGLCAGTAPAAFRLDGPARRARPVAEETEACAPVRDAAEGCPVEAIAIRRADTGEEVFPPPDQGMSDGSLPGPPDKP